MRAVPDNAFVLFEPVSKLTRPMLIDGWRWARSRLTPIGMLEKNQINALNLAPFIRHASLFELLFEGSQVVDFKMKVIASQVADNITEASGKTGKDNLPEPLFHRWLKASHQLIATKQSLCAKSSVYGKDYKNAESLIIPVSENGQLTHSLVFSDYWVERIEVPL